MIEEGDELGLCPHCGGQRLHPGDRIAIGESADPATARSIRTLARLRGLRVVLRSGPGIITLDPGTAQRRIEDVCQSGATEAWLRHRGRTPERSGDTSSIPQIEFDFPAPAQPGRPRRTLLRHPVSRDPLYWVGALGALLVGVILSWQSGPVHALLVKDTAPQVDWLRIALQVLTPADLAVVLIALGWLLSWAVLTWLPALIRRSMRVRMDAEALLLPPIDRSPGWRSDPTGQATVRWWNGLSWTGAIQPIRRPGWLWPITAMLLLSGAACLLPAWAASAPTIALPTWTSEPPSAPANPTPARYAASLREVDEALLAYSAAADREPFGVGTTAAFETLRTASARLAAVTVDEPGASQERKELVAALEAYIAVRVARDDDAARCTADRPDTSTCLDAVLRSWQERVDATIEPLALRYAAVASAQTQ